MSETIDMANRYLFNTYKRHPICLKRGKGCVVWDEEGREYLDFVGGIAVCALGHGNPVLAQVMFEQAKELVHVSNLFYTRPQAELARLLVENSFGDKVFFCNSGAEANEAAIKLCRKYSNEKYGPGRHTIISMFNSFHGRTMATLSATGQDKIKQGYEPLLEGFRFVPFNDLEALGELLDETVCGIIIEPIQGEGGVVPAKAEYLRKVREICTQRDILLIFDEVQVGMGRTGRLFAYEHYGVEPDILTLAKAIANGLPMGAMIAKGFLADAFGPGSHASTFGGTPLICKVALAQLKLLLSEGFLEGVREKGEYFQRALERLKQDYKIIKEVRGKGLILGMELTIPGTDIVDGCRERGLLINCTQERVLRFLPPLIVSRKEINHGVEILKEVLKKEKG